MANTQNMGLDSRIIDQIQANIYQGPPMMPQMMPMGDMPYHPNYQGYSEQTPQAQNMLDLNQLINIQN